MREIRRWILPLCSVLLASLSMKVRAMDFQSPRRLAVSADGTKVAVATEERCVRVWDTRTFKLLHTFETEEPAVSIAFAGTSDTLVAGDSGGFLSTVYIWKPNNGVYQLASQIALKGSVSSLNTSADGQWAAAGSPYGFISLINIAKGKLRRVWLEYGNGIADVAFSPDSKTLYTAGQAFRVWNTKLEEVKNDTRVSFTISREQSEQDEKRYERFHRGWGVTVAPLPDGKWVAAVGNFVNRQGYAADFVLMESEKGETQKVLSTTMKDDSKNVMCLTASPDCKTLAVGYDSETLELWSVDSGKKTELRCDGIGRIRSMVFLKDGKHLVITNDEGHRVVVLEVATGKIVRVLSSQ